MSPPRTNGWRYVQWARKQTVGDASAKAVLNALATYVDWQTGSCIVGQETLAAHTEKGVSTVRAALRKLEDMELISRRGRGEQGRRLADEITLTPDPLPLETGASERSTIARFERTTARKEGSLPPKSGGVTLLSEHALRNSPAGDASHEVFGRAVSIDPIPTPEQVRAATQLLRQWNCYGTGPTIGDIWESFRSHAETTGRKIKNVDKAWIAWVGGFIDRERAKDGRGSRPKSERQRA